MREMPPLPVLRTARLLLRGFEAPDAAWLAETISDPQVRRLTLEDALPPEQAVAVAQVSVALRTRKAHWVITLDGEPCGFICLTRTAQFGPPGVYAGFELRRRAWGRGIATEALQAAIDCGFHHFGLPALHAAVVQGNAASERVLEKAGLREGGACTLPGGKPGIWYAVRRPGEERRRQPFRERLRQLGRSLWWL